MADRQGTARTTPGDADRDEELRERFIDQEGRPPAEGAVIETADGVLLERGPDDSVDGGEGASALPTIDSRPTEVPPSQSDDDP